MSADSSPYSSGRYVPPPSRPAPPASVRPGRIWYLAALAVLLAGVAWLVIGLVTVVGQVSSFQRVALPGQGVVTLKHSGGYVIYYEARGASSGSVPALAVTVKPASGPAAVRSISPYTARVSYTFGSREGRAVLGLNIASPGRFLVRAPAAPAVPGGSDLAIGGSVAGGLAGTIVSSVLLMNAGVAGLVLIAVMRYVRARRAAPPRTRDTRSWMSS